MNPVMHDIQLHGHRIRLREYVPPSDSEPADDDVLVLLHGIAGSGETWDPLLRELARRRFPRRVLAPDMVGHGESATPRGDYGLGACASLVRDLLLVAGHEHATVVGHSLGGWIAMQFAYQYPGMCGRLVLVDSGGLGREVTVLLRATSLPGARWVLAALTRRPIRALVRRGAELRSSPSEAREMARHFRSLADPGRRAAFFAISRALSDFRGQRGDAVDRLYLAAGVPALVVWGARDWLIPVRHGRRAASLLAGSSFEVFEDAEHFPHAADPERFADVLAGFLDSTTAARRGSEHLVPLLRSCHGGTI